MCKDKNKWKVIIKSAKRNADQVYLVFENRDRADLTTVVRVIGSTAITYDVKRRGYVVPQRKYQGWTGYPGHTRMKRMTNSLSCAWIEEA